MPIISQTSLSVEKVALLCQFISVDVIRDSSVAKSTLVHAFVYLISAVDDVHNAVAAKAMTMLTSIKESSLLVSSVVSKVTMLLWLSIIIYT